MEDLKYFESLNNLSSTVKELATEKDNKNKTYKFIITFLIIANIVSFAFSSFTISYFIYNAYNYKTYITNVNANQNGDDNTNTVFKDKLENK